MIILSNMLSGWHCRSSLSWDIRLSPIHYIFPYLLPTKYHFFKYLNIFMPKTILFQRRYRNSILRFLAIKTFRFWWCFCTYLNNILNQWQKCIDVQGLIKTLFKFNNSGIKVYSMIGYYFPSNLIIYESTWISLDFCR